MNPVTGLSLGRIAVGIASLAKPDLVASQLGQAPGAPLVTRWFGSREIALAMATLLSRGSARRNLVLVGMSVDAADAGTAYAAVQKDELDRTLGTVLMAVAGGAVVSGLFGLVGRRSRGLTDRKAPVAD